MSNSKNQDIDLSRELETAQAAAREAGIFLVSRRGQAHVLHKKEIHDDLLDVDEEAEAIIIRHLQSAFPADGIHSEEAGADNSTASRVWIVDPLDGSANFQHRSPVFGVAIGLIIDDTTMLSVIYLPVLDEMYSAVKGQGAFLNDGAIQVSNVEGLDDAIIYVGDFAKTGKHGDNAPRIATVSQLADNAYRVRMVGTAATDFAYVASGRADGLIMYTSNPWDIKAGTLLVEEAGGKATAFTNRSGLDFLVYGNPYINKALADMVAEIKPLAETAPKRLRLKYRHS